MFSKILLFLGLFFQPSISTYDKPLQPPNNVGFFLINLLDAKNDQAPYLINQMYMETNAIYYQNSFGNFSFAQSTIFGPYNVSGVKSNCDLLYSDWVTSVETQAQKSGINLTNYPFRVFVLPSSAGCSWFGVGTLQCTYPQETSVSITNCRSTIRYLDSDVLAHELGHNLGMNHASTSTSEYGDQSDPMSNIMGLSRIGFNGPHTYQMHWANITSISKSGTYKVYALRLPPSIVPQIYTLSINGGPRDCVDEANQPYYISYRGPFGYDISLKTYQTGLSIHSYAGGANKTYLQKVMSTGNFWFAGNVMITQTGISSDKTYVTFTVTFY